MEVLWCRICETDRKLSCLDDQSIRYLGCNVCGLILRTDDWAPEFRPKQHPVQACAQKLGIFDEDAIEDAMVCYEKAFGHFESREIVAAICLYIGCRANGIPIMLFELSTDMCVSVYHLGLVFLDACEILSYEFDDGFRTPDFVDPVFFVHWFTLALFEENKFCVLVTALRSLAAIKSNYYVGGCRKRLAGLCAAAVYMAAGFHTLDVDNVVPDFQAVLTEKLVKCEFDYHEFTSFAKEYIYLYGKEYIMGNVDVLCPHNVEKFSHGFCHVCYNKFVKLSGYFSAGSDAMKRKPTDLEYGIAVPREQDEDQVLCGEKRLSSIINFDALRQVFGDDVAQSTYMKRKESNGTSNAMEQGQTREENWGNESANVGDAQGREDSADKLGNKVRRQFGQPKRPTAKKFKLVCNMLN